MADIKDHVGDPVVGGVNQKHDLALVEAMLRVVKNAKGLPYLNRDYGGIYKPDTKAAIIAFQKDSLQQAEDAAAKAPNLLLMVAAQVPIFAAKTEKLGVVKKGSYTWIKLQASLPKEYKDLRVLENTTTVYLAADAKEVSQSQAKINALTDLLPAFRAKMSDLVQNVYEDHGIVLWVVPGSGGPRTFAQQLKIWNSVNPESGKSPTEAGPGESNHNFGQATDSGAHGLKWLHGNGTVEKKEDWWLHRLSKNSKSKFHELYHALIKARDEQATGPGGLGLHRANDANLNFDPDHLQAVGGKSHSGPGSLVKLLNQVGQVSWDKDGKIKKEIRWSHHGSQPEGLHKHANIYTSDLGEGSTKLFKVGSAAKIFNGEAQVDKQLLVDARNDRLKLEAAKTKKAFTPLTVKDITDAEVEAAKRALQKAFQGAEDIKAQWQP